MGRTLNGKLSRVIRTEVGQIKGSLDAMIVRIEHLPLAEDNEDQKPDVAIFVLSQKQVALLEEQILESFGTTTASPTERER